MREEEGKEEGRRGIEVTCMMGESMIKYGVNKNICEDTRPPGLPLLLQSQLHPCPPLADPHLLLQRARCVKGILVEQ